LLDGRVGASVGGSCQCRASENFAGSGCRCRPRPATRRLQRFPHPLEGRRPRHPHPEASQGGVSEVAMKLLGVAFLRLRVKVLLSLYSEIRRTITAETSLLRCDPVRSTRYTCAPATNLLKQGAKGRIK